jgi:hypothetical protein
VGGSKSCSSTVVRCVNGKEEEFYCDPCAGPNQIDCNIPDGHVSCGNGACVPGGQTCGGGQGGGGQGGAGAGGAGQGGAGAGGAGQGGAGAGGAGQGGAGAGGGTGGTTGTSIEGSFDLLFADVKAESSLTGGPPVSLGTKARIDIRKSADDTAYEALFTSSFSSPQGMTVSVTADKVTLSG